MSEVSKAKEERIWEDVRKEFPDDEMMQEIHYVQQLHYLQTRDLPPAERFRFYGDSTEKASS